MSAHGLTWRHLIRRIGLPGFAAMGLAAVAVWGECVSVPQIEEHISTLEQEIRTRTTARPQSSDPSRQHAISSVYDLLPTTAEANPTFEAILEQARKAGLVLDAVQYRNEATRLRQVSRHEMKFPIKGAYGDLRSWLETALHSAPSLSLDMIELKRHDTRTQTIEADVVFSLWVKAPATESVPLRPGVVNP